MEYGLIGEHLGHSYSAEIHGMIADYKYELKEIETRDLDEFMTKKDFKAINVTIPYKQDVIPYLDEISDQAKAIGAVNTIVNKDGRLYGYNTDFAGMSALIRKLGADLNGAKVLILGTGGTSKTALAVAESMGAREVYKVSRHVDEFENENISMDAVFQGTITYNEAVIEHCDTDVIINTTPSGMYPKTEESPIELSAFFDLKCVVDAIYNPLRSKLIQDAMSRGIPAEGGLYMLSAQAVYACGYFLDEEICVEDIDKAYEGVLAQKQNIVLIGMPTSGKSTIGMQLIKPSGKRFMDSDEEVVRRIGMSISDYFAEYGEAAFRDKETEAIKELAKENSQIIATGGGAILREENIAALKRNGIVIFLDRPLEKLITTDDRPLSSDREALEKRFVERYDLYRAAADIIVDASGDIEEVTAKVKEALGLN